eukprot:8855900-Karenia_brevis.AAC.1
MGMPPCLKRPLETMYAGLRRRFRMAGSVGREFTCTNGILQGCPISVLLLNALVAVWCKSLKNEVPEAFPSAYVDDTSATAAKPNILQRVLQITEDYATLTGQDVNMGKSCSFSTGTNMKRL